MTLIDTVLPRWDVHEMHGADVAATPEATWAAVQAVTVRELPVTCLLMALRSLYWRFVGLGSALIRRDLLRAVRRRAEAS